MKPIGFGTDATGQRVGVLRIDYLTLWNRDDGVASGFGCGSALSLVAGVTGFSASRLINVLSDHDLDNERSAALIAAPVPSGDGYNTDPSAYKLYAYFTSAHEGTGLTEQSRYPEIIGGPLPSGTHALLTFSRSKHATYNFNPDGLPIVRLEVIGATYASIASLAALQIISPREASAYYYAADVFYYACTDEEFESQGGSFANPRFNVGEPDMPLTGFRFIQTEELFGKLTRPVFPFEVGQ